MSAQFASMYSLQEPAALAAMLSMFKGQPVEQFGPPSAELWTAVLVSTRAARGKIRVNLTLSSHLYSNTLPEP
jgi:hypothetical protein